MAEPPTLPITSSTAAQVSSGGPPAPPKASPDVGEVLFGRRENRGPTVRSILRVIVTVVGAALALYIVYRLRTPLSYLFMAVFLATVMSAPVAFLSKYMPKGLAMTIAYFGLIAIPIGIGAVLIPPLVRAISDLVNNFPGYIDDLKNTISNSKELQDLNDNFDLTSKLEDAATNLTSKFGDVAGVLADIGTGLVGSIFALLTILIMSLFMVSRGGGWIDRVLELRPRHEAEVIKQALDNMAVAVGAYVGAALLQATIAGVFTFIVLSILGVPSPLALAVVIATLDLIPLVGATLGAILVGIVTLFNDFPTVTIIWAVWAIAYQQVENYVIQPRIQGRAVQLDPFIIVIAALFGGTLFGVVGALIAIPFAAAGQIGVREFLGYRRAHMMGEHDDLDTGTKGIGDGEGGGEGSGGEPPGDGGATGGADPPPEEGPAQAEGGPGPAPSPA